MSGEHNYTVGTENDKQTRQDNTSTDAKTVTLSENSAPLAPSWWEKKVFNEALRSSKMGVTETSSVTEGITKGEEANTGGGGEPLPTSEPTDFGQGVKTREKKSKDDSDLSIMTHEAKDTVKRKLQEAEEKSPLTSTLPVEEAEELVEFALEEGKENPELLLEKGEETPELKLQEDPSTNVSNFSNQTEQFAKPTNEKPGLPTKGESNEFDEPQEESTSLMRISPPSSENTETVDAQENPKKPPKDKFWILEKGWGRYSRYKKPNFMRFDFIKFY